MVETPPLKRIGDLPLRTKLKLLLIIGCSIGAGVFLALSPPRTMAIGRSLLFLVAMPVAAMKCTVLAVMVWRSGRRLLALLYALLALLFALLALAALSWFLAALSPSALTAHGILSAGAFSS